MMFKQVIKTIDTLLKCCVLGILVLATLTFLFVFILNWEDWFFTIKLDGLPAGLFLLARALGAGALAGLIVQYPKHTTLFAGISVVYFGFIFLNSAFTIQKNTGGQSLFSPVLAGFLIVAVAFFVFRLVTAKGSSAGIPE
ncbi:MAG: hypothetical protein M0R30_00525 [Methanoregula sp.]|jgi:hypothetical protein|uniref:hypothetical protein n=1 Tax=Methanoregula sp. TaxID=2052170 RepID=UPI0025EA3FA9|nr:hypothetical protein [Methanoregula sp.]MCK9630103.1 hypothetical protein [Methanoregula sp.]